MILFAIGFERLASGFQISGSVRETPHDAKLACSLPAANDQRILGALNNLLCDAKHGFIERGDGIWKGLSGGEDHEPRK
jgi:hypothetical protein